MRAYCKSVGLEFRPEMLEWDSEEAHEFAKEQFEKWDGFHDDAINSRDLRPRQHVSVLIASTNSTRFANKPAQKKQPKTDEQLYNEWVEKYGKEAADMIKQTVDDNVATYEYLKQYAIKL